MGMDFDALCAKRNKVRNDKSGLWGRQLPARARFSCQSTAASPTFRKKLCGIGRKMG